MFCSKVLVRKYATKKKFIYIRHNWHKPRRVRGRNDIRHLCWLVSWSHDAWCGLTGCLSCRSHAVAPGCPGTWRPWGQRWNTPQLKPGTGLAYCHPVEKTQRGYTTLYSDDLTSHNQLLQTGAQWTGAPLVFHLLTERCYTEHLFVPIYILCTSSQVPVTCMSKHRHTRRPTLTTSRNTTARSRLMSTSCRRRSGSLMGDRLLGTVSKGV